MNKPSLSPIPPRLKTNETMDFPNAIKEVINGKKIHKLEWEDKQSFGILKDGTLKLHKPDGKFYQWIVSEGDLVGIDWITIP